MKIETINRIKTATKFKFTWAMRDGAWLEIPKGGKEFVGWAQLTQIFGEAWIATQIKKQDIFQDWVNI